MAIDHELQATPRLTKALGEAQTPEELKDLLNAAVEEQSIDVDRNLNHNRTRAVAPKTETGEPTVYTRTEIIGGKSFTFDAESELELERSISNAYKVAEQFAHPVTVEPAVDPNVAAQQDALRRSELEMQFKRGEIDSRTYLEQSGAVAEYLANQGVPIQELKSSIDENRGRACEQSWADATQEFLNSAEGQTWPGGERNKEVLGMTLAGLGLTDAEDKLAAITQAYHSMQAAKTIFPYEPPESEAEGAPVRRAAPAKTAPRSSGIFGASSSRGGESYAERTVPSSAAQKVQLDSNASPAEIIDAWKKGLAANGQDPNAEFIERFSKR